MARIVEALRTGPPPRKIPHEPDTTRESAVLVPIFEEDGEAWLLLTRRAQHLRNHRGEVSFPGGRKDEGETLVETALREAHEEIGLDPGIVEIVGELDHLTTYSTGAAIVPYVGVLPGRPTDLRPNPGEVELVLVLPFSELLHDDTYHGEQWHLFGDWREMAFFDVVGDTIWGATARMLHGMITRVLFPDHDQ